jgi:photosystem II stability/assembly factor-like uncharacterized protein
MKSILVAIAILIGTNYAHAQWLPQTSNITPGYFIPFIDAVDGNVCWGIVADPADQLLPVQEFTRTIDGGNNWLGGIIGNAVGLCPSSICAINADTAWVAMFDPTGVQGKILRTDDGGVNWTWQSTALFSASGNFPNFVYFWNAIDGVCLGDPTGGNFEIYTTTDGGNLWTAVPSIQIPTPLSGEFGITDVFRAQGDSNIWFGTNLGRIYHSTDKGNNWTVAQTPFGDYIGAIAFRDAMNGLAVSGGATGSADVARTTDGGASWNLVGTNTAGMTLKQGLVYVPGTTSTYFISTPYAGSIDGTTFSPNDGNNWIPVDNLIHTDIDFVNDSTGWTGSNELDAPMFKWSTPITVAATDAATQSIDVATNIGQVTMNPQATVLNNGLLTQTFDVTMNISPGGYTSTVTVNNLAFFDTAQVVFLPWTPAAIGNYTIQVYTSLAADSDNSNDTLTKTVTVFEAFSNCGWVRRPNIPIGRFGLATAYHVTPPQTSSSPGTLFAIGGSNWTAVTSLNTGYSTATNNWSTMAPMPNTKIQFSAHQVNGKIYCSGGYATGFTPSPFTYIYTVASNSWSTGAVMPTPVGDYASGAYRDSLIYYIGGYNSSGDQNTVKIYNIYTNTWSTGTPKPGTACAGLRGAINGNTIIVVGGYSQSLATEIADAYMGTINPSNPTQITWTPLPPYPAGTVGRLAAGTVYKDFLPMILFLGGDPTGQGASVLGDCWAYDIAQSKWLIGSTKTTPVSNICDFAGVVYNDTLWMASVGGYDGTDTSSVHEWLCLGPFIWSGVKDASIVRTKAFTAFPNPSRDELSIQLNGNGRSTVVITDISGKEMYKQIPYGNIIKLNTERYTSGIYFISVTDEDGSITNGKFVKE